MNCPHCGAQIDATAVECPFCKVQTQYGVQQRYQQEQFASQQQQWAAQEQARIRGMRMVELEGIASRTLGFSLGGLLLCCVPLGGLGIWQGLRARTLARELGVDVPGRGKLGYVLSIVSCVTSVVIITWAMIQSHYDQEDASERIAKLEKRVGPKVASPTLDQNTACGLAEIHLLQNGWNSHPGYSLERFQCVGKLSPLGTDGADLEDFRFGWGSNDKYEIDVCFKHGAKWYVSEVRKGRCVSK